MSSPFKALVFRLLLLAFGILGNLTKSYSQVPDTAPIEHRADHTKDEDQDGISDAYEDELLYKFAPKVWLHPQENCWPVNVGWFLKRTTMRYSHPKCRDCEIIKTGHATALNITKQSHQNTKSFLFIRKHHGKQNKSDSYTAEPKKSFFLQFPNDDHHKGSTDYKDWEIYGHVYRTSDGQIVIQYWQLYAYNDSLGPSNHEGDWEFSGVIINANEIPAYVFHYRHGEIHKIKPDEAKWEDTHHFTYSAKGGHGQYPSYSIAGVIPAGCLCSPPQFPQVIADSCFPGIAWDTWDSRFGGITNIGEKEFPLNGSSWIKYSGLWGEIGMAPMIGIKFTSGPQGPAYQKGWNLPK